MVYKVHNVYRVKKRAMLAGYSSNHIFPKPVTSNLELQRC